MAKAFTLISAITCIHLYDYAVENRKWLTKWRYLDIDYRCGPLFGLVPLEMTLKLLFDYLSLYCDPTLASLRLLVAGDQPG